MAVTMIQREETLVVAIGLRENPRVSAFFLNIPRGRSHRRCPFPLVRNRENDYSESERENEQFAGTFGRGA